MLPSFFGLMLRFENYQSNTELFIHLLRCISIRLATLVLTAVSVLSTVHCRYESTEENSTTYQVHHTFLYAATFNFRLIKFHSLLKWCFLSSLLQVCSNADFGFKVSDDLCLEHNSCCSKPACWENYVGQQFYRLTVIDLAATLIQVLMQGIRVGIGKLFRRSSALFTVTFDVPTSGLAMIYSQVQTILIQFICFFVSI